MIEIIRREIKALRPRRYLNEVDGGGMKIIDLEITWFSWRAFKENLERNEKILKIENRGRIIKKNWMNL